MKRLLAIFALLMLAFAPTATADSVSARRVLVDPEVKEWTYIHDLIAKQLDPADDITVHVEFKGPAEVEPGTTHVIAFDNPMDRSVSVYGDTNWPDHATAVEILSRSEDDYDPINRILRFIREVHAWQAANPIGER